MKLAMGKKYLWRTNKNWFRCNIVCLLFALINCISFSLFADDSLGKSQNIDSTQIVELVEAIRNHDHQKISASLNSSPFLANQCRQVENDCLPMLLVALEENDEGSVQLLLEAGANPDGNSKENKKIVSPLMMAIYGNNQVATRLLLDYGADPCQIAREMTPLTVASLLGRVWHVAVLLRNGADPLRVVSGKSAEQWAEKGGHSHLAKLLKNPDIWLADLDKQSQELWQATANFEQDKFNLALKNDVDINWHNGDGFTALHIAARDGRINMVQSLVSHGAKINLLTKNGWSPLLLAAKNRQTEVLIYLVKSGAKNDVISEEKKNAKDYTLSNNAVFSASLLEANDSERKQLFIDYELIKAALNNDATALYQTIKKGARINQADDFGWQALHYAIRNGDQRSVRLLLSAGADVEELVSTQEGMRSPLMLASFNRFPDIAYMLMSEGADPELVNDEKDSALSIASKNGFTEIVSLLSADNKARSEVYRQITQSRKLFSLIQQRIDAANNKSDFRSYALERITNLIEQGIDVSVQNEFGWTPLQMAARDGDLELVKLFLDHGADADKVVMTDDGARSALELASWNDELEITNLLKNNTHQPELIARALTIAKDKNLTDIATVLTTPSKYEAIRANRTLFSLVKKIKETKFEFDRSKLTKEINMLLAGGLIDIRKHDKNGMLAAYYLLLSPYDNSVLLKELLPRVVMSDEILDTPTKIKYNPLMMACLGGNLEQIKILLERGYSISASTSSGHSALQWSEQENKPIIRQLLTAKPKDRDSIIAGAKLLDAIDNGDGFIIQNLLDEGKVNPNVYSKESKTPVHYLAEDGHSRWLKRLLYLGGKVNNPDKNGQTPLMLAAKYSRPEITKILLGNGAKSSLSDNDGKTAADYAAASSDMESYLLLTTGKLDEKFEALMSFYRAVKYHDFVKVKTMLESSVISAFNKWPFPLQSPVHIAAINGDYLILKILLQHGYDPNIRDEKGRTPLMLAASHSVELVNLLQNSGAIADLQDNKGWKARDYANSEIIDYKLLEQILDKLWLPMTKPSELVKEDTIARIQNHYPLNEFDEVMTTEDSFELIKTSIRYTNPDALQFIISATHKPFNDEQIYGLLETTFTIPEQSDLYLTPLLTQFSQIIFKNKKLSDQLGELCLKELPWCLTQRQVLTPVLDKLASDITSEDASFEKAMKKPTYAECEMVRNINKDISTAYSTLVRNAISICEQYYPENHTREAELVSSLGHQKKITALAQQNGGQWIASGDEWGKVIIWEKATTKILNEFPVSGGAIKSLFYAKEQPWLIAMTDEHILVWDVSAQQIRWQKDISNKGGEPGQKVLWIANGNDVVSLSLATGRQIQRWHTSEPIVQLLHDGDSLITASAHLIARWSETGQLMETISASDTITRLKPDDTSQKILIVQNLMSGEEGNKLSLLSEHPILTTTEIGLTGWLNNEATNIDVSEAEGINRFIYSCNDSLITYSEEPGSLPNETNCYPLTLGKNAGPIQKANSSEVEDDYFRAVENKIELVRIPSDENNRHKENEVLVTSFEGQGNDRSHLCHLGGYEILMNTSLGKRGINLSDRGLPAVITKKNKQQKWLCSQSESRYFSQNKDGKLYRYRKGSFQKTGEYNDFSSWPVNNIFDNPKFNQVVVIGTRLTNHFENFNNHVVIYDSVSGDIVDEFAAFPKSDLHSYVSTSLVSPDGNWLVLFNTKEVLLYNLKDKVIAARRSISGNHIALNDEFLYIKGHDIRRLPLGKPWSSFETVNLYTLGDSGNHMPYIAADGFWGGIALDEEGLLLIAHKTQLYRFDLKTGQGKLLSGEHKGFIEKMVPLADGNIITLGNDSSLGLWNIQQGYNGQLISFNDGSWAVLHKNGLFDASTKGMENLYFRVGDKLLDIEQLKGRYFEPYLLQKMLGINEERLRDASALRYVAIYPQADITEVEHGVFSVKVTDQGGGIGELEVYLNNKRVTLNTVNATKESKADGEYWRFDLSGHPYLKEGDNTFSVVTQNRDGYLSSRGLSVSFKSNLSTRTAPPKLYVVSIGVSDYQGDSLDLRFSAKDAKDMEYALVSGAERLFGVKQTHSWLLSTDSENPDLQPTKENIQNVFSYLKENATSEDILILYLSGHGITLKGKGETSEYYFLTENAFSTDINAYRDPVLLNSTTLSSSEIVQLANDTSILKQVLILDTCASGQVVENLAKTRDLSSDALRALEQVQSRTGMHVITGSTADAVSYEASQFGQGLLTYSLLEGMKGAALDKGSFVDVVKLFSRARERVPELARNIGGIQQPVIFSKADSFYIGELDENARDDIPLVQPKPVFLLSTLMNSETFDDDLAMETKLDAYLRGLSEGGRAAPLVFVESESYPDGIRIRGLYTLRLKDLKINVGVFRGTESLGKIELIVPLNEQDSWMKLLTEKIIEKVNI